MKHLVKILLPVMLTAASPAVAQQPEAVLRFDQAEREQIADDPARTVDAPADARPVACKLNRKWVSFANAYDAVTLWNVRRVRVKNRRMQLSDSTPRERVRLLKFTIERNRNRGTRPHLLGNVGGCMWSDTTYDSILGEWREVSRYLEFYTLREEVDRLRQASDKPLREIPRSLWHRLPHDAVHVLDGKCVPGSALNFAEGLILQTLNVQTQARYHTDHPVVVGKLYSGGRLPLVICNGTRSTIDTWLKMCSSGAFSTSATVPMRYFYLLPAEAVQIYGKAGKYGAICIEPAL